VDLPSCHCEQSWEGGKSRLASPDTGHRAKVREMLRAAHREDICTSRADVFAKVISLAVFPD